jgi:hypothetical protein
MSTKIKIKNLSMDMRQKIVKDLKIEKKLGKYEKVPKFLEPYYIEEKTDEIYLPFAWSLENIKNIIRPERKDLDKINTKFNTK